MDINNYVILDLETTGLKPDESEITEVGILEVKDGKITNRYDQLCSVSSPLPDNIVEITNITDEMLAGKPSFKSIIPDVLNFIDDRTIVGHNIHFDLDFLEYHINKAKFLEKNITFRCVDTLKLSYKYMPKMRSYKLEALKKYFDINIESHRAINDCEITKELFDHILKLTKKI